MIFSSGLGSVERYAPETAVKSIANHVRRLQEELEYRLAHLDSSNISEIDADVTVITGGPITLLDQSLNDIAQLKLTDQQLEADVQGLGGQMAQVRLQAGSIQTTVEQQGRSISTLEQTASGLTARVENVEGSYASLWQTVDGISTRVSGVEGDYSSLSQTVDGLTASVSGLDGKYAQLALTVDGFTVTNDQGETRIDGGCIMAGSKITAPVIEGGEITGGKVTGAGIYGGTFSDLEADSYLKMRSDEQANYANHVLEHYVGDADSSNSGVPVTAMGWMYADGSAMWYLSALGTPILTSEYVPHLGTVIRPRGLWDFSLATVMGLNAI